MGTKMTLRRFSPVTIDWETQEIIVDEEFIETHGLIIPIEHTFEPNKGLIEVYLQGQLLLSGGGYEERDDNTIRLDLGLDEDGQPRQLEVGEELFIKVYHNQYCSRGGANVSGSEVYDLKKGLQDVRQYLEIENVSTITQTINTRFESLRKEFEFDEFGDYDISYTYNDIGKIETETVTKGNGTVRTFTYNTTTGKIESERYEKDGQALTKQYFYNANGKIEKVRVRNA